MEITDNVNKELNTPTEALHRLKITLEIPLLRIRWQSIKTQLQIKENCTHGKSQAKSFSMWSLFSLM